MAIVNDNRKKAIYSRKSKFTGKGESVENQIEMCKKYLRNKYDIDTLNDVVVYEDEGYTGANTKRPQFQKMLKDIRDKKISTIICYRLDRISRNVLDFCSLKDELTNYDVSFISIKEEFDTSTPMGNAMLMISSVFAQLERDTIAERIRDNMLELAKTGRWLGGTTPTGYVSEGIEKITIDGKKRKLFKLAPVQEEQEMVKLIYDKYLQLKSQTKLETYLIQNDIKTKNGKRFERWGLVNILTNPVYAIADKDILNYYHEQNVEIFADESKFDGTKGIMAYNKTVQKTGKANKKRDISEWIISVGKHQGLVDGATWVQIQELLSDNASKRYRKPTINNALLSGLIRCSHCGNFMRPKLKQITDEQGNLKFDYMCELKEKSRKTKCTCKNINGIETDKNVLEVVKNVMNPKNEFYKSIKEIANGNFSESDKKINELNLLRTAYKKNQTGIDTLLDRIKYVDVELLGDITNEVKKLKEANKTIEEKIKELTTNEVNGIDSIESAKLVLSVFDSYFKTFDDLDLIMKRNLIKLVVSSITSDGEDLFIDLYGARGTKSNDNIPLCEDSKRNIDVLQR